MAVPNPYCNPEILPDTPGIGKIAPMLTVYPYCSLSNAVTRFISFQMHRSFTLSSPLYTLNSFQLSSIDPNYHFYDHHVVLT